MSGLVRYAALDALPRKLLTPVTLHLHGDLAPRARAVVALRRALLDGAVPSRAALPWPEPPIADAIVASLHASGIAALARGQPDVADEVVLSVLDATLEADRVLAALEAHLAGIALAALAESGADEGHACLSHGGLVAPASASVLDEATRTHVRAQAIELALGEAARRVRSSLAAWQAKAHAMESLRRFAEACSGPRGFSLAHGALRVVAGLDLASVALLVADLDALERLVAELGRLRHPDRPREDTLLRAISERMQRTRECAPPAREERRHDVARLRLDRSGDPARMLPSEAALLGDPVLRWLWHARRAERGLLAYVHDDATIARDVPRDAPMPRLEGGPILVCLDTSGSMQGRRGHLAKAVVAHLAFEAHAEGRPCIVQTFSGPGDVVEHRLDASPAGLEALVGFLMLEFAGGTDASEPLRRALAIHDTEEWAGADILLVSDGELEAPREIVTAIEARRRTSALRVHGLLVDDGDPTEMRRLCDPLHCMADWLGTERHDVRFS